MTSDGASQQSLFLCIASPYIPSSLLPPPQRSAGPTSSLFSIFLPLYYSLHAHLYFHPPSVPYSPCLPHPWAFRSTPAIEISFKRYLLVLSVPLSFRTHGSLRRFCPFTNLASHPRHHVGPGSSPASRQTFLSSFLLCLFLPFSTWLGCLSTGALMQRSWTVSKMLSASIDARWKHYRRRHVEGGGEILLFSWVCVQPILISVSEASQSSRQSLFSHLYECWSERHLQHSLGQKMVWVNRSKVYYNKLITCGKDLKGKIEAMLKP